MQVYGVRQLIIFKFINLHDGISLNAADAEILGEDSDTDQRAERVVFLQLQHR